MHLFEDDCLDDELIDSQELDQNGNPITYPDVDAPVNESAVMENDNSMIGSKIPLPHSGEVMEGTVRKRKRLDDGTLCGAANSNPLLDLRIYEVEFPDRTYQDYATNTLIENLYANIDQDGQHYSILKGIVGHKKLGNAISKSEGKYTDKHGISKRVITTKG